LYAWGLVGRFGGVARRAANAALAHPEKRMKSVLKRVKGAQESEI
jgi:hypothetical protein